MEEWKLFCQEILKKIHDIDKKMQWEEIEPEWWLHMQEVGKLVRNIPDKR